MGSRQTMTNGLERRVGTVMRRQQTWMESVNEPLKQVCPTEPLRHRHVTGLVVTLVAGIIASPDPPPRPREG